MSQSNPYHDWQKRPAFSEGRRAIPFSPPGQIPSKEPGLVAGWLRRVTLTYFIAVPLGVTGHPVTITNKYPHNRKFRIFET